MGTPRIYPHTNTFDKQPSAFGRWAPGSAGDHRRAAERPGNHKALPAIVSQKAKKPGSGFN